MYVFLLYSCWMALHLFFFFDIFRLRVSDDDEKEEIRLRTAPVLDENDPDSILYPVEFFCHDTCSCTVVLLIGTVGVSVSVTLSLSLEVPLPLPLPLPLLNGLGDENDHVPHIIRPVYLFHNHHSSTYTLSSSSSSLSPSLIHHYIFVFDMLDFLEVSQQKTTKTEGRG